MGIFRKEQNVKFIRDEYGRVVRVEKTGDRMGESRTPISDKLLAQQKPVHTGVKKKPSRLVGFAKKVDKAVVKYNQTRNPLTSGRRPSSSNANPFGSIFDMGMDTPKQKTSKGSTKYIIKGGKAYPVAKSKKKGKGKKKRSGGKPEIFDFDPFGDNWGIW